MNNLTDDDRQAIIEDHDPDYRDHFFTWEFAWDWYKNSSALEQAIERYQRDEENQLGHWWQQLDDDEEAIEEFCAF